MKLFLSERRHSALVNILTKMMMPKALAIIMASVEDNLPAVDLLLATYTSTAIKRLKTIHGMSGGMTNEDESEAKTFLLADLVILAAYTQEALERGVEDTSLPISHPFQKELIALQRQILPEDRGITSLQ